MSAPEHGREKCAPVHYCGDEAAAADLHLASQPIEPLPGFPTAIHLRRNLLVTRHERLAGLATLAATSIDPARRSLPCLVKVERVPHDLSPDAQRSRDEVDPRPGLRHLDELWQHRLIFRRAVQRNHDVAAAARRLSEHCPTVGM